MKESHLRFPKLKPGQYFVSLVFHYCYRCKTNKFVIFTATHSNVQGVCLDCGKPTRASDLSFSRV